MSSQPENDENNSFTFVVNPSDAAKSSPGSNFQNFNSPRPLAGNKKRAERAQEKEKEKEKLKNKSGVKKSNCLNEIAERVICVICGGSGSKYCRGISKDETSWLDDWMLVRMTPASERCIPLGPGKIRERGPYNKVWLNHQSITIDNSYNRNHGAAHRPVHRACYNIIERSAEYSAESFPAVSRYFSPVKNGGRIFDVLAPPVPFHMHGTPASIRFENGLGNQDWASRYNVKNPAINYLAANPSFLDLETALEFAKDDSLVLKDPPIRKPSLALDPAEASNGKGLADNLFARLPTELIHQIAFHILRLSAPQPFACGMNWPGTVPEPKSRKRKTPPSGYDDDLSDSDGPDYFSEDDDDELDENPDWTDEDDDEGSDEESRSESDDSKHVKGTSPRKGRAALWSKYFEGERSLLSWRASSRFLYHFSFDKAIWKRLVFSRSQKFAPFSFTAPYSFQDHKCGAPNDVSVRACVDGHNKHPWLKKIEKEAVEKVKSQDDLDPEMVYRSIASLHSIRNAERLMSGWETFESSVVAASVEGEMHADDDDDDDDDDAAGLFPGFLGIPGVGMGPFPMGPVAPQDLDEMMGDAAAEMFADAFAEFMHTAYHHGHQMDDSDDGDGDEDEEEPDPQETSPEPQSGPAPNAHDID